MTPTASEPPARHQPRPRGYIPSSGEWERVAPEQPIRVGRYELAGPIAAGGMATIHLGRQCGDVGFSRIVAIKRLFQQCYWDPDFIAMFVDEARLAARIHHPNVVSTLDVVSTEEELLLILEYVHGESLWTLLGEAKGQRRPIPIGVACAIVCDALNGLHAVHHAKDRFGRPLDIVHRDVSPQNILVGTDGVARVLDFGIAKASDSVRFTLNGSVRGKVAYLAPEQITQEKVTHCADLFAAGVVLWELLTGTRLFGGGIQAALAKQALGKMESPREHNDRISPELEAVVMKALSINPEERFQSGREMAAAIARVCPLGTREDVANWVQNNSGSALIERSEMIRQLEQRGESMRASAMPASQRRLHSVPVPEERDTIIERELEPFRRSLDETPTVSPRRAGAPIERWSMFRLMLALAFSVLLLVGALAAYWIRAGL